MINKKEILAELQKNIEYDTICVELAELITTDSYRKDYEWNEISSKIISENRWSNTKENVTEITHKESGESIFIMATWDDPATEEQEGQDTLLKLDFAEPKEKTIITYFKK